MKRSRILRGIAVLCLTAATIGGTAATVPDVSAFDTAWGADALDDTAWGTPGDDQPALPETPAIPDITPLDTAWG
ncbi:hypothetical protein ACIQUW_32945 [Streptomyces sp. NPDC101117]|uniref:hypothetical protein n=1 Tax=Streptomyces sp. NPDC101117 TaxID=3366108 RepID=UPI00381D12D2